jgi:hypothetical protein
MRKVLIAAGALIFMVLSAYAQQDMQEGYHAPSQFERSLALCELFALRHINLNLRIDPAIKKDFVDNCMTMQGYVKDKVGP